MAKRDLLEGDALDDLVAKIERDSDSQFGPSMVDVRKVIDSHAQLWSEYAKLLRFKDYVHQRLDEADVPTHPDGEHSAAGCRVGDRLDIALKVTDRLAQAVCEIQKLLSAIRPSQEIG